MKLSLAEKINNHLVESKKLGPLEKLQVDMLKHKQGRLAETYYIPADKDNNVKESDLMKCLSYKGLKLKDIIDPEDGCLVSIDLEKYNIKLRYH